MGKVACCAMSPSPDRGRSNWRASRCGWLPASRLIGHGKAGRETLSPRRRAKFPDMVRPDVRSNAVSIPEVGHATGGSGSGKTTSATNAPACRGLHVVPATRVAGGGHANTACFNKMRRVRRPVLVTERSTRTQWRRTIRRRRHAGPSGRGRTRRHAAAPSPTAPRSGRGP